MRARSSSVCPDGTLKPDRNHAIPHHSWLCCGSIASKRFFIQQNQFIKMYNSSSIKYQLKGLYFNAGNIVEDRHAIHNMILHRYLNLLLMLSASVQLHLLYFNQIGFMIGEATFSAYLTLCFSSVFFYETDLEKCKKKKSQKPWIFHKSPIWTGLVLPKRHPVIVFITFSTCDFNPI